MGFLSDLLSPDELPYPGDTSGGDSGSAGYPGASDSSERSGFFSRIFGIKEQPYPTDAGAAGPGAGASATAAAAATAAPAPAAASGVASAAPAAVATAAAAATSGAPCDELPIFKTQCAYAYNPAFEACYPTAQQIYIEDVVGEVVTTRMITRDGAPVAFVVPEGTDSMGLLLGPIEVNPSCGCEEDLDLIVTVGDPKLNVSGGCLDRPLVPGEQVVVTVPWRAASWVDLPANRLRVKVIARFYKALRSD